MDYSKFKWHEGLLFLDNHIYIPVGPPWLQALHYCHDSPLEGHFGAQKTLEFVADYVDTCNICCRSKIPRHRPYYLLQPSPIPIGPWKSICLDFITELQESKGFDAILTVVDRSQRLQISSHA